MEGIEMFFACEKHVKKRVPSRTLGIANFGPRTPRAHVNVEDAQPSTQNLYRVFFDPTTQPQSLPAMSTPIRGGGLPDMSTTMMPPPTTPHHRQYDLWTEPSAASQIAKRAGPLVDLHSAKRQYAQYLPRTSAPPPGLSFKKLCNSYPNHLDGDLLIEMSDAGLKPRDIVEMMPADTRNPHLGTEWCVAF